MSANLCPICKERPGTVDKPGALCQPCIFAAIERDAKIAFDELKAAGYSNEEALRQIGWSWLRAQHEMGTVGGESDASPPDGEDDADQRR